MKLKDYAITLSLVLILSPSLAQESKSDLVENQVTDSGIAETHKFLSEQIVGFADYIDSYFGRFTRTDKKNKTRLILSSNTKLVESEGVDHKFDVKARLSLPHLEELLKFKINKQKRIENVEKNKVDEKTEIQELKLEQDYYFLEWKLGSQVGIDVSLKPDIFANINTKLEIGDRKNISRIDNSVFVYARTGPGNRLAIEYDRLFSKNLLGRFQNSAQWQANTGAISYSHGPELYYTVDDKSTFFFDIKAKSDKTASSNWAVTSYESSIVYNRRLNSKWLLLKTGPIIDFAKERNFESRLSYFIQFQVFIGSF